MRCQEMPGAARKEGEGEGEGVERARGGGRGRDRDRQTNRQTDNMWVYISNALVPFRFRGSIMFCMVLSANLVVFLRFCTHAIIREQVPWHC
jgi:hypothetical protein